MRLRDTNAAAQWHTTFLAKHPTIGSKLDAVFHGEALELPHLIGGPALPLKEGINGCFCSRFGKQGFHTAPKKGNDLSLSL